MKQAVILCLAGAKPNDPIDVEPPLLSPKTRGHIKSLMHRLFEKAMLWELLPHSRNPIGLVEIKGVSKRQRKPFVMTVDQFHAVVAELDEPYREMVQVPAILRDGKYGRRNR